MNRQDGEEGKLCSSGGGALYTQRSMMDKKSERKKETIASSVPFLPNCL